MGKYLARLVVVLGLVSVALVTVQAQPAAASGCDDLTISTEADLVTGVNCFNLETSGTTVLELTGSFALSATVQINNPTAAKIEVNGGGNTVTGTSAIDAFQVDAGDVTLRDLTISGAGDDGLQLASSAIVRVENSTIELSSQWGIRSLGALTVVDSAIVTNGSGIWAEASSTLTMTNSTIAGSTAGTGIFVDGAAIVSGATITDHSSNGLNGSGTVTVTGSLIARNNFGSCNTFGGLVVSDGGANLSSDTCGPLPAESTVTTGLGTLGPSVCGSGRSTCAPTVPIAIDSPAVDLWGDCNPLTTDQRGAARAAGKCDAGAFEGFDCPTAITDEPTFGVAIRCYNRAPAGSATTLALNADIAFTALPSQLDNATTATLTIQGNGHVLTGELGEDFIPFVKSGDLTLEQVTLTGSSSNGIDVGQGAALTVKDSTISESADHGINVDAAATVTVQNSTISRTIIGSEGIQASYPGPETSISIDNTTISGFLGGIATTGQLTVTNSAILRVLGGIRGFAGSSVTVTNSTIDSCATEVNCFPSSGLEIDGTSNLTGATIVDFANGIRGTGSTTITGSLITRINNQSCRTDGGLVVTDGGGNVFERDCDGGTIPNINGAARLGVDADATPSVCGVGFTTCTPTVKIDVTSPAVDGWGDCSPVTADQRGAARTTGKCDAGAYEAFDCPPATVNSEEQLAFAIRCYNEAAAGTTTTLTLANSLTLTSSLPAIDNPTDATLVIDGDDTTLNGAAISQTLNIANGDVTVTNLTMSGSGSQLIVAANASKLTITNSLLTGAEDDAILLSGSAQLTMTDSVMLNNSTVDLNGRSIDNRGGTGPVALTRVELANEGEFFSAYGVSGPNLMIVDSTFVGFVTAVEAGDGSTVSNTTITDNDTGLVTEGAVDINHVTSVNDTRSLRVRAGSTATLANSLVAARFGGCLLVDGTSVLVDGLGNVVDNGCGSIAANADAANDLGALAANPCEPGVACTKTRALGPTSPALGAADTCGLPVDQRGIARLATECDAGAYEAGNFAPTAADDIVNTPESFQDDVFEDDPPLAIDVLANDSDPDGVITVTAVSGLTPNSGSIAIDPGGTGVTYTLAANFNGTATFDYTITDAVGATDTATVTVDVFPRNDPPEADDDAFTVSEDSAANVFDVLANDDDIDGDTLTLVSTANYAPTGSGFALIADGKLEFTPGPNFVGEVTFDYTINDGTTFDSFTDTATVTVTVENVNEAPAAVDDNSVENTSLLIVEDSGANVLTVLDNDTDPDTAFGDVLTVASVTQPATGGTAAISGDGSSVILTPDDNYAGSLQFTYVAQDTAGLVSESATAFAFVSEVNDAPIATDDTVTVDENTQVDISVLTNDTDADHVSSQFDLTVTQPANGTTSVFGQRIRYVAPQGFLGQTTFTYTIEDPDGASDTATVTVTVQNVNEDPITTDDSFIIDEDSGSNSFDVLANDEDPDAGDSISVVSVSAAGNGTSSVASDGASVNYTPNPGYDGVDQFTYTINDESGAAATARVFIFVTDSNRQPVANDDEITVEPGVVVRLDVLSNDNDPDGEAPQIAQVTQPFPITSGTVEIIEAGAAVRFTALPNFVGTARFFYSIVDQGGKSDSAMVDLISTVEKLCGTEVVTLDMNLGDSGVGTSGDDVILGTPGDDVIDGRGGNDTICGLDGRDRIRGGAGDDTIFGGFGIDYIYGDAGKDTLDGEGGSDRMFGGLGNDLMLGDSGADRMFGGPGNDEMRGMGGQDSMWGEAGDDLMQGNFQSDNMWGGPGDDTMFGAGGKDSLLGEGGNDSLNGGNNTDYLNGGADVDTANGGRGRDKPLTEPKVRAGNGRLYDGSGCIAETIVNCQPTP